MAIAEVQSPTGFVSSSSAATVSVTAASPITTGSFVVGAGGFYYKQAGNTIDITTPAAMTLAFEESTTNFANMMECRTRASWGGGDGDTITTTKTGTNRLGGACVLEYSGVLGVDGTPVHAQTTTAQNSLATGSHGSVSTNGSLAIAIFFRQRTASGNPTTFSFTGGFSEILKVQGSVSSATEVIVATLTVNASDTPATTISHTGTASYYVGGIIVLEPVTATPPTVTADATVTTAIYTNTTGGTAKTLNPTIAITDGTTATLRLRSTSGKGTMDLKDLDSGVTLASGTRGSTDVTFTGTTAQVIAADEDIQYTPTGLGADAAVIMTVDDGVNSAVDETITITNYSMTLVTDTQTKLNTALALLTYRNANEATETLTCLGTDDGDRTGTNSANTITVVTATGELALRRRRRLGKFLRMQ